MDFKRVRFEEVVDLWKWRGMQELQLDRKQIQTEEIHAQRLRDMEDAYCTKMLVETARSFFLSSLKLSLVLTPSPPYVYVQREKSPH